MYLVSLNRAMVWYLKSSGFASTFKIRTLRRSATKSIDEQTDLGYLSFLKKEGGQVDQAFWLPPGEADGSLAIPSAAWQQVRSHYVS